MHHQAEFILKISLEVKFWDGTDV